MYSSLANFFKEDIWFINTEKLSKSQIIALKYCKIFLLAGYGFFRDLCMLRASALTLYTVLSIVPVFAMLFGLTKGFGYQEILKENLLAHIPEQETMMLQIIGFAENMLDNTKGGVVASIGILVLLWTVIKVISTIEQSFNEVWKVKKGRQVGKRVGDYLSLMLFASMLLIASSSMTVFVRTRVTEFLRETPVLDFSTSAVVYLLGFSPMGIMWGLFTFIFIFLPNTRVNFKSGLFAGVFTGTIYQLVQWAYINLQIGVSSYNAVYGSFAALPLFLVWLQIAWLIVLLGSEVSFYHQNYDSYRHHDKYNNISFALRKVLTLQIMHLMVQQFVNAGNALTARDIMQMTSLPVSVVFRILTFALECGLIVEIKRGENEDSAYQPAKDTELISVYSVITAMENYGDNKMPDVKGLERYLAISETFAEKIQNAEENCLLKQI